MVLIICLDSVKLLQVLLFNLSTFIYQVFLSNADNFFIDIYFQIINNNNNLSKMILAHRWDPNPGQWI